MMNEVVWVKCNKEGKCMAAREFDCIYTTHPGDRWKPVMEQVAGTITRRPYELATVVRVGDVRE